MTKTTFDIEYSKGFSLWIDKSCAGYYSSKELLKKAILNHIERKFKPEDMEGKI